MPPNARPTTLLLDEGDTRLRDVISELLDSQANTDGLAKMNYAAEDWTDVKHSERKKRDRILDDGVLLGLMKKSDAKGIQRLATNLGIMAATAYGIHRTGAFVAFTSGDWATLSAKEWALFLPLYLFFGFCYQAFAFAGQHEFLHRNAFKTKAINDVCLYLTGLVCFELGAHERVMHKQHHTFTNNIDRDPELTSFYTREQLVNPGFRNLPHGRVAFLRSFLDPFSTWMHRLGRITWSALGVAVDYSGWGWSMADWRYSDSSGIMRGIQAAALSQLAVYGIMSYLALNDRELAVRLFFWWILPVFLGYPSVNYVRNLEHADCEISKEPNCLRNTRTVESNLVIRTLLWDTNYHAEHHCYPMVPFFNLHKVHALMKGHVLHGECGHFTTQNWAAVKPGGWIDQQSARCAAHRAKAE